MEVVTLSIHGNHLRNHLRYDNVYDSADGQVSASGTDTLTYKSKATYEYNFDLNNNLSKGV